MVLKTSVSQGDILDTSLILLLCSIQDPLSHSTNEHAMQFCPLPVRKCVDERFCRGGLHAPRSDLDSLSSPSVCRSVCLSRSLTLIHVEQGISLTHTHLVDDGAVQMRTHAHTHTEEHIRCTLYGPHRSKSSLIPLFQVKRSGISTLSTSLVLQKWFLLQFSPEYQRMSEANVEKEKVVYCHVSGVRYQEGVWCSSMKSQPVIKSDYEKRNCTVTK